MSKYTVKLHQKALLDCLVLIGRFQSWGDCFNPQPSKTSEQDSTESAPLSSVIHDPAIPAAKFCCHRTSQSVTPQTVLGSPTTTMVREDFPPNRFQPPTAHLLAENLAGQPNNMLHQPFSPNNQPTLPSLLPSQMCAAPPLTDINPTLPPSHTPTASRCLPHQVTPPIPVATQPSP